jgi:glycosyltransferase involved in cell wall biosynthesis
MNRRRSVLRQVGRLPSAPTPARELTATPRDQARRAARDRPAPACRPRMTRLIVAAHSAPAHQRAQTLFRDDPRATVLPVGDDRRALARAARTLVRGRARGLYLIDIGRSTALLAVIGRLTRTPVIVDTGDLVYALERSRGARSRAGLAVVWAAEKLCLALSSHVVVRGREHLGRIGRKPATFAPDLAPEGARPLEGSRLREELGLSGSFVVGLVGSMHAAPGLGITYGWEIVEALAHLDERFAGLFVGDGDGRGQLQQRARELGVAERCRFVGVQRDDAVLEHLGAIDVAISTQTNDAVGAVRTTGKLPLYLACGTSVLATDVGEARRLLSGLGWKLRYDGVVDRTYPQRLAARLREWEAGGEDGARARQRQALALYAEAFDPNAVRSRVRAAVASAVGD